MTNAVQNPVGRRVRLRQPSVGSATLLAGRRRAHPSFILDMLVRAMNIAKPRLCCNRVEIRGKWSCRVLLSQNPMTPVWQAVEESRLLF